MKNSGKRTCPIVTLSTTTPTWTDLGVNPGLCSERLAINCLSQGMDRNVRHINWFNFNSATFDRFHQCSQIFHTHIHTSSELWADLQTNSK
jgi:hypothetical protein